MPEAADVEHHKFSKPKIASDARYFAEHAFSLIPKEIHARYATS